jgi:hypothetical protein
VEISPKKQDRGTRLLGFLSTRSSALSTFLLGFLSTRSSALSTFLLGFLSTRSSALSTRSSALDLLSTFFYLDIYYRMAFVDTPPADHRNFFFGMGQIPAFRRLRAAHPVGRTGSWRLYAREDANLAYRRRRCDRLRGSHGDCPVVVHPKPNRRMGRSPGRPGRRHSSLPFFQTKDSPLSPMTSALSTWSTQHSALVTQHLVYSALVTQHLVYSALVTQHLVYSALVTQHSLLSTWFTQHLVYSALVLHLLVYRRIYGMDVDTRVVTIKE